MNGCTHPFRGATDNVEYSICECCGDSLRANAYPVNMTEEVRPAMREAKARYYDTVLDTNFGPKDGADR